MTASPARPITSSVPDVVLTVMNGPQKGTLYPLANRPVGIGREAGNDIVLDDGRASRNHALVEKRNSEYWIKDLESQNGVLLNGKPVTKEAALKFGDQILVGATILRFGPPAPPSAAPVVATPASAPPLVDAKSSRSPGEIYFGQRRGSPKKTNPPFLLFAVVVAIGFVLFMKSGSDTSSKPDVDLKDDAALDKLLDSTNDTNEKREQEILKRGKNTQQYSEAQAYFLRGFRDFREENYSRAVQNFDASLILFPSHPLAKRYRDRARLKLDEKITDSLRRGEKDFELQKYQMAFNEYRSVLVLSPDPNSKNAQLAQKRIEAIRLIWANNK